MRSWLGIDLFANPEALLLLLMIPMYLFWYIRYYQRQRLVIRLSYDPGNLGQVKNYYASLRWLPRMFQLLALALIILAIARPQSADEVIQEQVEGIDIMLVLDISASMELRDLSPNRLKVAKDNAITFVQSRKQDRIGLVVFASEALTYAPLTLDHDLLINLIKGLNTRMIQNSGTALGQAIAMGITRMQVEEEEARSSVMVLLTDGANNRGAIDPISAAKLARESNIRIYTIGIGNPDYQFAAQQTESTVPLNEQPLKRVANLTGGAYYRVKDPYRLQQIFAEISQLETRQIEAISYRQVQDRYPVFIKFAILFLGLSFLLMLTFVYNPLEQ